MASITAADYRGALVTGKRWRRVYRVVIQNPYLGTPVIAMDEEEITEIEGQRTAAPTETLTTEVEMEKFIDLIDPSTGLPTGQKTTQLEIYLAIYSLYRALGAQRDAKE